MQKQKTYAILLLASAFSCVFGQAHAQSPAITFADILAAPSDSELNMRYAKQQAAKGDILSALSALERILLSDFGNDAARLYYAELLSEVDDLQAVKREVKILAGRTLSEEQRARLMALGGSLVKKTSPVKNGFSGLLAAGIQYDDSSAEFLAQDISILIDTDDISYKAQGALNYTRDLGNNIVFTAGVTGQLLRREEYTQGNFDALAGSLGLRGSLGEVGWSVSASRQDLKIDGEKYAEQMGGQLTLATNLSKKTKVFATGGYYDQDFNELPFTNTEELRDGDYYRVGAGVQQKITDKLSAGLGVHYENKSAVDDILAYDGMRFEANATLRLPNQAYMRANGLYRVSDYKDTPARFTRERTDTQLYLRGSAGIPISSLGIESDLVKNITAEMGLSYLDRGTNIDLTETQNFGADARLIWTF